MLAARPPIGLSHNGTTTAAVHDTGDMFLMQFRAVALEVLAGHDRLTTLRSD